MGASATPPRICPECGTHVYAVSDSDTKAGFIVIRSGTLDKASFSAYPPEYYIYTDSKPAWFEVPSGVKSYPKMYVSFLSIFILFYFLCLFICLFNY